LKKQQQTIKTTMQAVATDGHHLLPAPSDMFLYSNLKKLDTPYGVGTDPHSDRAFKGGYVPAAYFNRDQKPPIFSGPFTSKAPDDYQIADNTTTSSSSAMSAFSSRPTQSMAPPSFREQFKEVAFMLPPSVQGKLASIAQAANKTSAAFNANVPSSKSMKGFFDTFQAFIPLLPQSAKNKINSIAKAAHQPAVFTGANGAIDAQTYLAKLQGFTPFMPQKLRQNVNGFLDQVKADERRFDRITGTSLDSQVLAAELDLADKLKRSMPVESLEVPILSVAQIQ